MPHPDERRFIAAVIGSARTTPAEAAVAEELGRCLVDAGFRVLTGGMGGVMEAACRGAHTSPAYQSGDTLGVLPTYAASDANPWVDIPICTGLNHARNLIVVATADVVLIVGGRAGTLSEIALAWQLGRPLIAVDTPGWGHDLAGSQLDDRGAHPIEGPFAPAEAAARAHERVITRPPMPRREF